MDNFELSFEQSFEMRKIQDAIPNMSREQLEDLLIQASKLVMMKDNVIRNLIKKGSVI